MKDSIAIAIALGFEAAIGVLFIWLAIPLARRRVPRNGMYGVRLPATLADDVVWYDINARGGRHMIGIGVAYLLSIVVTAVVPWTSDVLMRIFGPLILMVLALMADAIILGIASSRQLARRRRRA